MNDFRNTSTMATSSSLPKGWEVRYGKSIFTENKRKNKSLENSTILSLSYGKIIVKKSPDEGLVPAEYSGYQILAPGDIVIRCTDLQNDQKSQRVGIVEVEGIITSAYLGLKVNDGVSSRYIAYWLKNWDATKEIYRYGSGLRQSLSWVDLKYLPIPLPPLPEQEAIVAYLDAETGRIDKAIAAEEKMIALLQERREIVINEAVGGGEDFNAEAQRRRGWMIGRLKNITVKIGSGKTPKGGADVYSETGVPFIRSQNVYNEGLRLDDVSFISSRIDEEMKGTRVYCGDVLLNITGGSIGRCCLYEQEEHANVNQHVCIIRVAKEKSDPRYVKYFINGHAADIVGVNQTGGNREGLNFQNIGNISIPLPPLPEQEAIVERLDRETGKIDRAIEVKRRQIELLRERRQIVIDEAVTGKVKVV